MKKLFYVVSCILIFSCSVKKSKKLNKEPITKLVSQSTDTIDYLTTIEGNIINNFLEKELASDRYKNYKNHQVIVIMESLPKKKAIESYLFSQRELMASKGISSIKEDKEKFFLDSIEIKKINSDLKNESIYHWKAIDFKSIKVSIQKKEDFLKTTKTDGFLYLPSRLIFFLSKPLIIDNNKALISFNVGDGDMGYSPISYFSALIMKKNNMWVKIADYEDGIYY